MIVMMSGAERGAERLRGHGAAAVGTVAAGTAAERHAADALPDAPRTAWQAEKRVVGVRTYFEPQK